MRNDVLHDGKLSAAKFPEKNKLESAEVISKNLNWIDEYIANISRIDTKFSEFYRWNAIDIENRIPALSFNM